MSRAKFASSAVALLKDFGFDGLDVDWEYPADASQAANYVELLKACREEMDAYAATLPEKHHFELTVASPAGPQHYEKLDLSGMDRYLDFWNLMAYDFAGSWDAVTGHQANIEHSDSNGKCTPFSTERAVEYYKSHGVAGHKIVVGMPLYGRAFENTDGLGCGFSGVGAGSWENGCWDYKVLPHPGAEEIFDEDAKATYSYDPASRRLVSYDTPHMARLKAQWVKKHKLGGAMWWESSADGEGEKSLIGNVVGVLHHLDKGKNCLDYPHSQFENLKKKFQV